MSDASPAERCCSQSWRRAAGRRAVSEEHGDGSCSRAPTCDCWSLICMMAGTSLARPSRLLSCRVSPSALTTSRTGVARPLDVTDMASKVAAAVVPATGTRDVVRDSLLCYRSRRCGIENCPAAYGCGWTGRRTEEADSSRGQHGDQYRTHFQTLPSCQRHPLGASNGAIIASCQAGRNFDVAVIHVIATRYREMIVQ
jgi:hypothetical protein